MRKLVLIAQISLDGFVAGPNGEFDFFIGDEENLELVCSITNEADAALLGRVSYQLLNSSWPTAASQPNATKNTIKYSNWYNRVPKIVLSKTLKEVDGKTIVFSENIAGEINKIKSQPGKDILLFGSPTALHSLLQQNLLDSFWLIIHPVNFGKGVSLFKESNTVIKSSPSQIHQLSNGTVCIKYDIQK